MQNKYQIYEQANLGGRVGFGMRGAVLVVDFQRSFVDPSVPGGGDFTSAVTATGTLLEAARRNGLGILYTVTGYEPHLKDAGRFIEKCPTLQHSILGSGMTELDERLGHRPDEPVIVKKFASAFFGTTVASLLTGLAVDTVIIAGCTTSGCIRASTIDAMQHGFKVILPRQCVADIAVEPHEANLFDIDAKYGDVVDLELVLAKLPDLAASFGRG